MKKALLYGLAAVMLLSLTACGAEQANQPDEPDTTSPSAVQTEPPQESAVPSDKPDNVMEPLSADGNVKDATETELYTIFEQGYQGGHIYIEFGLSEGELILMEMGEVESILSVRIDVKAPVDLESQYRAWRAEAHPAAPVQAPTQSPAPAETQSSTGGQQQKPVGGTQQTGGGSTTHTQPPKVTNQGSGNDGTNPGIILDYGDGNGEVKADPDKTQSAQDAGYLPGDPSNYIYGN